MAKQNVVTTWKCFILFSGDINVSGIVRPDSLQIMCSQYFNESNVCFSCINSIFVFSQVSRNVLWYCISRTIQATDVHFNLVISNIESLLKLIYWKLQSIFLQVISKM